ncbi:winged helix-turn-helix domain-containing protein [Echinimonas agarilytica]|uniref:Winged helix-turn-helix domain-containing protein n=1 Tax=Echinimonas agarilytica TaxID=1215918 RepID=A0AA41W400_9GAMM|nr:winged helix-turn-helix domain-containing protein [Echinimonas agarilytica]MCM2678163.1 winged helix-turn-helix domain-containing protein [Echinimonas agarilytica]
MHYHFVQFKLDFEHCQLTVGDECVALDERFFKLFEALIEVYPDYCSKADLLHKIWADTVVSEWSLSKLVSDARKEFSKLGYAQEVIQTLNGRGYRLAADIGAQLTPNTPNSPTLKDWLRPSAPVAALLLLLAAMIGGSSYLYYQTARLIHSHEMPTPIVFGEPTDAIGRILWVDDHPLNNHLERHYLEQFKIGVYASVSSEDALRLLDMYPYQAVVSDMGRHGDPLAGIKLLEAMRARDDDTPFYVYTIVTSDELEKQLTESGGQGVAVEPAELYDLILPIFEIAD